MTTTAPRICVTGATGKAGRTAVRELREQGYQVLAEVFPDVPLTREIGEFDTLLAIGRAKQFLGYEPRYSWRDQIAP
jgi:NAD(P)-dependent dehydrogenase (short-subunit alcohol dehydrogenase family)